MKKFNFIIILSIAVYFIFALLVGYFTFFLEQNKSHNYRVESNRILNELQEGKDIDFSKYSFIKDISYLEVVETNKEQIERFFTEENERESFISPFFEHGILTKYVKFIYIEEAYSVFTIFLFFEIMVFCIWLYILLLLLNIKYKIIIPFNSFSSVPEILAKGHYTGEIKMEKSKYFKQFLSGMNNLKDELDVSKKKQLDLLKEKKQLLLSLSHDIKTPLNLIKLYKQSLEENIYSNEQEKRDVLKQIGKKTDEIEHYVDEITTSFREEIMDLPVVMTEFYLEDILKKVFTIYKEKCKLQQINLTISGYKNRLTKGDANRIQEVLENIFENAIKYGDGREICVTFSEEDYYYIIHMYNTGTPVLEHEFVHLFDSFFRGMNAKGKQGSGLGLYISKQLMCKMDGDIYAESKKDGMMYSIVLS